MRYTEVTWQKDTHQRMFQYLMLTGKRKDAKWRNERLNVSSSCPFFCGCWTEFKM